jgi:hypothetical protein
MAFAKRKTGGGESFPLLKWDGRVGRLYTQDREQQKNGEWQSVQNDVTDGFVAAFDIAGTEHGYMRFPKGAAPEMVMVPMGSRSWRARRARRAICHPSASSAGSV